MPERNHTEIWSTRLQREIVALESSDDESKKIELLPPFIKTIGHKFNFEGGKAKILFRIDVELSDEAQATSGATEADEKKEGGSGNEDAVSADADADADADGEGTNDKDKSESDDATTTETGGADEGDKINPRVILLLDASLYWRPDSTAAPTSSPQCYPFVKPIAIIRSGSNLFSSRSTIRDGDEVDIDLDWTPSIHLSDAATNVALKIRECVKTGEPLHPAKRDDDIEDGGLSGSLLREAREAKESLLETKKAVGAIFSSGFSSLSAKSQSASKSMTKGLFSLGESLSTFAEAGASSKRGDNGEKEVVPTEESPPEEVTQKVVKDVPDIGDEIDLSDEPWSQCIGMYSCKAIKRPAFVEEAIAVASKKSAKEVSGVVEIEHPPLRQASY
jgi:hypothetical protein